MLVSIFTEPEPEVFITLSAAVVKSRGRLAERRLQLNWFNIDMRHATLKHGLRHNHTLYLLRRPAGLFRIDEDAVYTRDIGLQSDGQVTTHISFPRWVRFFRTLFFKFKQSPSGSTLYENFVVVGLKLVFCFPRISVKIDGKVIVFTDIDDNAGVHIKMRLK